MTACNHSLLHVGTIQEQLANGSPISVSGDPTQANTTTHHQ
jgi:hypothetical protein